MCTRIFQFFSPQNINDRTQYVYPFQTHPSTAIMSANKTGAHQTSIYNKSNYTVIVSQHTMKIRLIYEHRARMTPQTLTPSGYNLEWWPPICKDPVLGRYDLFSVFISLMMFHFMIVCTITVERGALENTLWWLFDAFVVNINLL